VRCAACAHRCTIGLGGQGACRVRFNDAGTLHVPWGYVSGAQIEPIEKKPFFHVAPGARTLGFGMLGCDMRCGYCQNWTISQAERDPRAGSAARETTPERLIEEARRFGAGVVVSTYNEPFISVEWAVAVFAAARRAGLLTAFITNGHSTPEALEYVRPWVDLVRVDLKCFDEVKYRRLGGHLSPVLESIRSLACSPAWLEVVTLIVPGLNDDPGELRAAAEFLAGVSVDMPWHLTAFHPEYRLLDVRPTLPTELVAAAACGRQSGLRHVYAGNLAGRVAGLENTTCAGCGEVVVRRHGFRLTECLLDGAGRCPRCATITPGRWQRPPTTASAPLAPATEP
jgi:pyruvate formate lyase activating enzyme